MLDCLLRDARLNEVLKTQFAGLSVLRNNSTTQFFFTLWAAISMKLLKRIFSIAIFWLGPLAVAAGGGWMYLQGGRFISTDNAYLKSEMISISSEISGKVVEVLAADNTRVTQGQLLFRIDDQIYHIAHARAQANILKVRSTLASLRADYLNKQADVSQAEAEHTYLAQEYERLHRLAATGAVSAVQVDEAAHEADNARILLDISRQGREVVKARLIDPNLPLEQHPDYLLAVEERNKASLDLTHVEVFAPRAGVLAHFEMQAGELVAGSVPLFSLVDDSRVWIEANFKETDLTWMRLGQTAEIKIDAYPDFKWQGKVVSITPGTGSEFSLLPAQNSSGNWVKVVQRISVKLEMELLQNPPLLTAGMSAQVIVDTKHQRKAPWQN